jgi:peptidase M28-like protein
VTKLAAALAILVGVATVVALRLEPPPPQGSPDAAFSAARALSVARDLLGDGAPRPVGSAADRRVAETIAEQFRALGYLVEVQEAFACGPYGACASVRNVVARPPGRGGGAVLLVAHHDSVGAGPGVADDLAGVAVLLETARALRAGPPTARPVAFLVDDAEETGLVGAAAFLDRHPLAAEIVAVVNVEARGTAGASLMFETTGEGEWLLPVLRRLPRPVTGSLFSTVYQRLPNDTDLTLFRRRGLPGLNFAFARGVTRYHTPRDDLAHLSAASLQHQGDHVLAAARALADAELGPGRPRRVAFADVLAAGIVSWPEPAGVALALGAVAACAWAVALLSRRGALRPRGVALAAAAALAGPALAAALALGLRLALRGSLPRAFVASPTPFSAAAGSAGLLAAAVTGALARPARALAVQAGTITALSLLALGVALAWPGASPPLLLPALAAAAALLASALGEGRRSEARGGVALVAVAAAGLVLFPVAWLLPDILGTGAAPAVAALAALTAAPLAPLVAELAPRARWGCVAAGAVAVLACAGVAATRPQATPDDPQRLSLAYHEDAAGARWLAESETSLPPALARVAAFESARRPPFPWSPNRPAFAAPARPAGLAPPRLTLLSRERRGGATHVRARLASARGAPVVLLLLPPGTRVRSSALNGVAVPPPSARALLYYGDHAMHGCTTVPPEGVELELVLEGTTPVHATLLDQSPGLPPDGAALQAARPADAVPSQEGDVTLVTARVTL